MEKIKHKNKKRSSFFNFLARAIFYSVNNTSNFLSNHIVNEWNQLPTEIIELNPLQSINLRTGLANSRDSKFKTYRLLIVGSYFLNYYYFMYTNIE